MSKNPNLKLVKSPANNNKPLRTLQHHGTELWNRVTSEYDITDAAGKELLQLACESLDRAESLRATIAHDGERMQTRNGFLKEHPCLRHELASRSFVAKMLMRLGLDVEPMRPSVGRPGGAHTGFGWQPPHGGEE